MRLSLLILLCHFSLTINAQLSGKEIRDLKSGRTVEETSHVYTLPWAKGKTYMFIQGANTSFSHKGELAYDFKMKEGSTVHAARSGIVTAVRNDSKEGGLKKENLADGNYIFILHNDGSTAQYWHFKLGGVLVKEGEKIEQGQLIGYSGNTGYSAFPHLHFQVTDGTGKEILVRFATRKGDSYLRPGKMYKRSH